MSLSPQKPGNGAPAAEPSLDKLFIHDLILPCEIGVHAHEQGRTQRVRFNLTLLMRPPEAPREDKLSCVVNYDAVLAALDEIIASGPVRLVETLAERIAERCLTFAPVERVQVRVEKLDRIPGASLGIEIERAAPLPKPAMRMAEKGARPTRRNNGQFDIS